MGAYGHFSRKGQGLWDMASMEREPITGVWWQSPQRGPGAEPLIRDQGKLKALKHFHI